MTHARAFAAAAFVVATTAAGCGGGGTNVPVMPNGNGVAAPAATPTPAATATPTPAPTATPTPTPAPTATPAPSALIASTSALIFGSTGASYAQTFTVSESGYSGPFTVQHTCNGVATVGSSSTQGPSTQITVTPSAVGSCAITVNDGNQQAVTVNVAISTTSLTVSGKRGR